MATPVATPQDQAVADLTGVTPLPLTGERLATFEAYVAAKLAEAGVPGAAVAVVQGGEVVFLQGFGVREIGQPAPVTADTLLRIGSVTKSFSSLLTATLVDAGRLSWDTPLVDLLPDFAVADPELTPRLTVRDAFCACTGLPRRDFEFIFNANELTPELLIAGMAELPLTAPYGEKYQYSNQMVAAGGFAAAVADGGSPHDLGHAYAIALRERVLNPIGMPRTTLALADVLADGDYAMPARARTWPAPCTRCRCSRTTPGWCRWRRPGRSGRARGRWPATSRPSCGSGVTPDGAARRLGGEPGADLAAGRRAPGAGPGTPPDMAAFAGHYALGWVVGAYGGQRLVWHSGGTLGFTALVSFLPEADLGVVVLTNGSGSSRPVHLRRPVPAARAAVRPAGGVRCPAGDESHRRGRGTRRSAGPSRAGRPGGRDALPGALRQPRPGRGHAGVARDELIWIAGAIRSQLLPRTGDDGAVTGYLPVIRRGRPTRRKRS